MRFDLDRATADKVLVMLASDWSAEDDDPPWSVSLTFWSDSYVEDTAAAYIVWSDGSDVALVMEDDDLVNSYPDWPAAVEALGTTTVSTSEIVEVRQT